MSKPKNSNYNIRKSSHPIIVKLFDVLIVLIIGGVFITAAMIAAPTYKSDQTITDVKADQVAVVTAVDMSNGQVTLGNGDIIPADALKMTPHVDDVLSYTKAFEYTLSGCDGPTKRTNQDKFLNVESIGKISK